MGKVAKDFVQRKERGDVRRLTAGKILACLVTHVQFDVLVHGREVIMIMKTFSFYIK